VAENHGLGDGDASIDVTQSLELLLLAVTQYIVLLDGVQGLLLPLQLDDVGFGHNFCFHKPLNANTLVLVTLCGNHDVSFIQDKHLDLLGVYEPKFTAPVQHSTRCANDDLLLHLTFISSDGVNQFNLRIVFSHLLDHLTSLKSQLIASIIGNAVS
uniref:Uncharacterized protein n=1 Tax=Gouania willdenowi TaxID=441366 RepID=A0A8C5HRX8_GOUWI